MPKSKIPKEIASQIFWAKSDIKFFTRHAQLAGHGIQREKYWQQVYNAAEILKTLKAQGYDTD